MENKEPQCPYFPLSPFGTLLRIHLGGEGKARVATARSRSRSSRTRRATPPLSCSNDVEWTKEEEREANNLYLQCLLSGHQLLSTSCLPMVYTVRPSFALHQSMVELNFLSFTQSSSQPVSHHLVQRKEAYDGEEGRKSVTNKQAVG